MRSRHIKKIFIYNKNSVLYKSVILGKDERTERFRVMKYKYKRIISVLLVLFLFSGCNGKDGQNSGGETVQLELPGYGEPDTETIQIQSDDTISEDNEDYYVPQGTITLVQETENKRKAKLYKEIIEIIDAKKKGEDETVTEKLAAMSEEEPAVSEAVWNTLLYWDETNEEGFANYTLDENLSQDDDVCFVVMGFALNSNGSMKEELVDRLEVALDAAQKYPNSYILCTGGGTASGNRSVTEAGQMAEWLKKNGIEERRIIIEDKAQDSVDNAVNSYRKLAAGYANVENVVIVTSDYHVPISCLLFETRFQMACAEGKNIRVVSNVCCQKASSYNFSKENQVKYVKEVYEAILQPK